MSKLEPKLHEFLTEYVISKLEKANIFKILEFITADTKKLTTITNLGMLQLYKCHGKYIYTHSNLSEYRDITQIKKHLIQIDTFPQYDGLSYYNDLKERMRVISTGIERYSIHSTKKKKCLITFQKLIK